MVIVGWTILASFGYTATLLAETKLYPSHDSNQVIGLLPAETEVKIDKCFDTGSDFYYAVTTKDGVHGYIFDLRMDYQADWEGLEVERLMNPVSVVSCLAMTMRWDMQ